MVPIHHRRRPARLEEVINKLYRRSLEHTAVLGQTPGCVDSWTMISSMITFAGHGGHGWVDERANPAVSATLQTDSEGRDGGAAAGAANATLH